MKQKIASFLLGLAVIVGTFALFYGLGAFALYSRGAAIGLPVWVQAGAGFFVLVATVILLALCAMAVLGVLCFVLSLPSCRVGDVVLRLAARGEGC